MASPNTTLSQSALAATANSFIDQGLIDPGMWEHHGKSAARNALRIWLEAYMHSVAYGYNKLLDEVRGRWGEGRVREFMIDAEAAEKLKDPIEFQKIASDEGVMQGYLRYQGSIVTEMYEIAEDLKEAGRLSDAAAAYLFLIYLNPYVGWFWQGVGDCWQMGREWEAAQYAYSVAINCEPFEAEHYRSLCVSLIESSDFNKAREVLKKGLELFKQMPHDRGMAIAQELLEAALVYMDSLESERRRWKYGHA